VIAAIIESFLTRYTEVPDVVRLSLILLSAFLIAGYFVIYPWMKSRSGFNAPLEEVKLPPDIEQPVSFTRIKNSGEIIKDSFVFYKTYGQKLFLWILLVTLLMSTAEFLAPLPRSPYSPVDPLLYMMNSMYYALKTTAPVYIAINAIGSSLILFKVFSLVNAEAIPGSDRKFNAGSFLQTIVVVTIFYIIIYFLGGWGVLLVFLCYSMFLLVAFAQHTERAFLPRSVAQTVKLCSENFPQVAGLQLVLLLMSVSFLVILFAPLLYYNTRILEWNLTDADAWSAGVIEFVEIFIKLLAFNLIMPIFGSSMAYLYFSLREICSAENLKRSISLVGSKTAKSLR
jgi:hypothetical protein